MGEEEKGQFPDHPQEMEGQNHQETQEPGLVALAYAVVDPWTVVVEASHTLITYVAMPGSLGADSQTVRTEEAVGGGRVIAMEETTGHQLLEGEGSN